MTKKISQLTALTTPADDDVIVIDDTSSGITKKMSRSDFFGGLLPPGVIAQYGAGTAPTGWLLCNGTTVNRSTYSALFAIIGTTYGAGDGSTTFTLPNLKGKIPVGLDASQTEFNALNNTGGEKTHILTSTEMPSHTHVQNGHNHGINDPSHNHHINGHIEAQTGGPGRTASDADFSGTSTGFSTTGISIQSTTPTNQNTGGDQGHNNLQPYLVVSYIIKT